MLSCQILTCKSLNLLISELASWPAFPLQAHLHITVWFWVRVFFQYYWRSRHRNVTMWFCTSAHRCRKGWKVVLRLFW